MVRLVRSRWSEAPEVDEEWRMDHVRKWLGKGQSECLTAYSLTWKAVSPPASLSIIALNISILSNNVSNCRETTQRDIQTCFRQNK